MKRYLSFALLLVITFFSLSCNTKPADKGPQQEQVIEVLAPIEFQKKSQGNFLLDVRTPDEFKAGHLEGAININFFDKNFIEQLGKLDKSKPVYLYCRSGNRSSKASAQMKKAGFTKVVDLAGGIKNWQKNDFKVVQ